MFAAPKARLAILTGAIRAGKTTAALEVARLAQRRGHIVGGFLSPDSTGLDGQKVGIDALRFPDGQRRRLATRDGELGGPRVGPYSFDQASVDWAIEAFADGLECGWDLLVVDELGRLELERGEGFAALLPLLARGEYRRALAVARLGLHERLVVSPERVEVRVFTLATPEDRERIPEQVCRWLFGDETAVRPAPRRLCWRAGMCD